MGPQQEIEIIGKSSEDPVRGSPGTASPRVNLLPYPWLTSFSYRIRREVGPLTFLLYKEKSLGGDSM